MKLSLAITTYNRFDLTIKSCAQVLNEPCIDDIVILDDASTGNSYTQLCRYFTPYPKVRVMRQVKNRGMSRNKADAIGYAINNWVAIIDSDNIVTPKYFDVLPQVLRPDTIYCPVMAAPNFDYRRWVGTTLGINNVDGLLRSKDGDNLFMALNTCNYVVNRHEYLKVYEHNPEMKATDTIWFNYLWLKAGNKLHFVKDMEYMHLVHAGSDYLKDADYNTKQGEKLRKMMMAL